MNQSTYLSDADRDRIRQSVLAAESRTAGEIVTILAERSDGYTDVALAWAGFIALLALSVIATFPDFYLGLYEWISGGWIIEWTPRALLTLAAAVATLKFGGMMLIQMWHPLKFLLIPAPIKTARVHHRAIHAFRIGAERRTHGRTGILIYLSMREHRAEIVADESIASKVDPEVWGDAMFAMLAELKRDNVADGMIAAIEKVGVVLAREFPIADGDINELPDRLIEV